MKTGWTGMIKRIVFIVLVLLEVNIFEERICLHTDLGQNKSVNCFNMTTSERKIVQPAVTELMAVKNVIDLLIPCITSLFLGPWSDINGRLPLFLSSMSGKKTL